ncbi:MAG: hypothetical protein KZQ60_15920 [Candidatus Thiodiazotropha sp. (ex Lucinoma aequizonata)]|nr:hypothetical protein [Candidatus Thiodiazotropha sp. (ex Lucinoma aequizonata)]
MHYSITTTAMTLRRLGCALCMPFISPFRSSFRAYNHAYAYRGLTTFAPFSMAVSECSHTHHCLLNTNQLYQCYHCHHQTSLTSGTIFANTKLPLTTWFLSMFLVTQTKEWYFRTGTHAPSRCQLRYQPGVLSTN